VAERASGHVSVMLVVPVSCERPRSASAQHERIQTDAGVPTDTAPAPAWDEAVRVWPAAVPGAACDAVTAQCLVGSY
jgi:hypothetical protein